MPRTTDAPGEEQIRWRCGCRDADHCQSPAKACQKVQRLEDERAALRAELAEARPVVALIERAATETYMGANEELLLMAKGRAFDRLIAAWDQLDHARALAARDGGEEEEGK